MTKKETSGKAAIESVEQLYDQCNKLRKKAFDAIRTLNRTKPDEIWRTGFKTNADAAYYLVSAAQDEIDFITKKFFDKVSLMKNRDRVNYEIWNKDSDKSN